MSRKTADLRHGLDVLERYLEAGCRLAKQDGRWFLWRASGDDVVSGETIRELVENLATRWVR